MGREKVRIEGSEADTMRSYAYLDPLNPANFFGDLQVFGQI